MSMLPIGDATTSTIYEALQGLTAQRDAIANDLANVSTPNYTGQNVDFESSLQQAVAAGDPSAMQISVTPSTAVRQADGNNVDMAEEISNADKNNLAYQTMIQAMNAKMQLLSTAISGTPTGS